MHKLILQFFFQTIGSIKIKFFFLEIMSVSVTNTPNDLKIIYFCLLVLLKIKVLIKSYKRFCEEAHVDIIFSYSFPNS
jgi:hypothetical protein